MYRVSRFPPLQSTKSGLIESSYHSAREIILTFRPGRKFLDTDTLEVTRPGVGWFSPAQVHVCGLPAPERGYEPEKTELGLFQCTD